MYISSHHCFPVFAYILSWNLRSRPFLGRKKDQGSDHQEGVRSILSENYPAGKYGYTKTYRYSRGGPLLWVDYWALSSLILPR